MTAADALRENMQTARSVSRAYLSDLSDADLMLRPVPGMNHIAWQLGHLIASEHKMVSSLGHSMPALPAGFAEQHTEETTKSDDPAKFHKKQQYLDLYDKVREATLKALAGTKEDELSKPGPEQMRNYCPTIGSVYCLLGGHEMMHAGQWVAVRRKLKKPTAI